MANQLFENNMQTSRVPRMPPCQTTGEYRIGTACYCDSCKARRTKKQKRDAEYQKDNKESINEYRRSRYAKLKRRVIEHYAGSPPKCWCCLESVYDFLTIDHINGGGIHEHRKLPGVAFFFSLIKRNFPEGYRILCWNCNGSRGHFGYCPHEVEDGVMP